MGQTSDTDLRNMIREPAQRRLVLWDMIKEAIIYIAKQRFTEEELDEKPIIPYVERLMTRNRPRDDDEANKLTAWVGRGEAGQLAVRAALMHSVAAWQDEASKQCSACSDKSEEWRDLRVCPACGDTRLNVGSDQTLADISGVTRAVWLKEHRPWYLKCLLRVNELYEASEEIGSYMPEEVKKDDAETAREEEGKTGAG